VIVRFNPDEYTDEFKYLAKLGVVRGHVARGLRDGAPPREITLDRLFFDGECVAVA
jgi:hypothetical protein